MVTIPIGAVAGAIVGGVVGAEHWHTVDSPVRVGLRPDGHNFALAVSVRF